MPDARQMEFALGQAAALDGMNRSAANAESRCPGWGAAAFGWLVEFAKLHSHFTGEELKAWAYREGLPHPPNESAWGGVMNRAARNAVIQFDGFTVAHGASRHGAPNRRWRSRLCPPPEEPTHGQ